MQWPLDAVRWTGAAQATWPTTRVHAGTARGGKQPRRSRRLAVDPPAPLGLPADTDDSAEVHADAAHEQQAPAEPVGGPGDEAEPDIVEALQGCMDILREVEDDRFATAAYDYLRSVCTIAKRNKEQNDSKPWATRKVQEALLRGVMDVSMSGAHKGLSYSALAARCADDDADGEPVVRCPTATTLVHARHAAAHAEQVRRLRGSFQTMLLLHNGAWDPTFILDTLLGMTVVDRAAALEQVCAGSNMLPAAYHTALGSGALQTVTACRCCKAWRATMTCNTAWGACWTAGL